MLVYFFGQVGITITESVRKIPELASASFAEFNVVSEMIAARLQHIDQDGFVFVEGKSAAIEEFQLLMKELSLFVDNTVTYAICGVDDYANHGDAFFQNGAFEVLSRDSTYDLVSRRVKHGLVYLENETKTGSFSTKKRRSADSTAISSIPTGVDLTMYTVESFVAQLHSTLSKSEVKEKMGVITEVMVKDRPPNSSPRKRTAAEMQSTPSQQTPSAVDIHCGLLLEQALLLPNRIPSHPTPGKPFDSSSTGFAQEALQLAKQFRLDVWKYNREELLSICYSAFQDLGLIQRFNIDPETLLQFLSVVQSSYHETNPYHNFEHAVDVTMNVYALLSFPSFVRYLMPLDILALMVSSIAHDVDHRGCNNGFEISTSSPLALRYNDTSVLENHHISFLFTLFRYSEYNILSGLTLDEYREVRRMIIKSILATDMTSHYDSLGNFVKRLDSPDTFTIPASKEDRQTIVNLVLHFADICNACKPWELHKRWQDVLLEEFFIQGDRERSLDMKVSNFCDRQNPEPIKLAVNFMDHFVTPLFSNLSRFVPELNEVGAVQLTENRERWIEKQIAELHAHMNDHAHEKQSPGESSRGRPF